MIDDLDIPVPDKLVADEVHQHLEGEGRLEDDAHRAEVDGEVRVSIKSDFLLDAIVKAEEVQVNEIELTEYLIRTSQRYGMPPEQFAKQLQDAGQITQLVAEVSRTKALAGVLGRVNVVDKSGNKIDLEALRPQTQPAQSLPEA
jgi:trigger factor